MAEGVFDLGAGLRSKERVPLFWLDDIDIVKGEVARTDVSNAFLAECVVPLAPCP
jgi:hypothetical protein